jgi:uncharacterized membrane protein (DUF485 family)
MITLAIAILFIWAGFVLSISFFESWVKFRAPGVDLKTGLSIGKKIFTVLNRIEWFFAVGVFVSIIGFADRGLYIKVGLIVIVLILQSFWLLPNLNRRATRIIGGERLPSSKTHIYFVVLELIKLILLVVIGCGLIQIST